VPVAKGAAPLAVAAQRTGVQRRLGLPAR
jgi:hypothetical protein